MSRHRPSWSRPFAVAAVVALAASLVAGSPAAGPAAVSAADPVPVAEWTFDEGTGSTAADSVGDLDGAITGGATWTAGANGSSHAIQFNGTDGLVTVANDATLEPAGNFSISMWVRGGASTQTAQHTILQKGDYGCDIGGSYRFYGMYAPVAGGTNVGADVGLVDSGFAHLTSFQAVSPMWDDTWHHVVLVVNDTTDSTTGWIDGYRWAQTWGSADTVRFGATGRLDAALHFGGPGADCTYWKPFDGAIDDVQLYGTALSDSQVLAMMPVSSTTTTMAVFDSSVCCNVQVAAALADHDLLFSSETTPAPGADAPVTWYLTKDGGSEESVGSSIPIWNNGQVPDARVAFLAQPAGTLSKGSYAVRAVWEGTPNWTTSASTPYIFTVVGRPVDMTLTAVPTDVLPGGGSTLTARLQVTDPPTTYVIPGDVEFHDLTGGGDVLLGSGPLTYVGNPHWNQATLDVGPLTGGVHLFEARYAGTATLADASANASVTAGPQSSAPYLEVSPNPVLNTAHGTAAVTVVTGWKGGVGGALPSPTGTITLKRVSTGAVIGSAPVDGPGPYTFQLPIYPTGTVGLVATYSGDANFDPSTGNQVDLVVRTDVVDATGVTLGATTFYPVIDGYKDTVAIKGVRNETVSVAIRIYNSTNHLVRSLSVASGTGPYSVNWNGRTSGGTLLAAGTYRVVQTLTDSKANRLAVSKSVALSWKKLYYTTKTLAKYADAVSSLGYAGLGYALKYSDHSVRVHAASGWVGLGWQFTLPTATTYRSLSIGVYGSSGSPVAHYGAQNFSWCAYSSTWNEGCFDRVTAMRTTTGWASRSVSPTYNRYGHTVRIDYSQYSGASHIYKVRVIVTYGILR